MVPLTRITQVNFPPPVTSAATRMPPVPSDASATYFHETLLGLAKGLVGILLSEFSPHEMCELDFPQIVNGFWGPMHAKIFRACLLLRSFQRL